MRVHVPHPKVGNVRNQEPEMLNSASGSDLGLYALAKRLRYAAAWGLRCRLSTLSCGC